MNSQSSAQERTKKAPSADLWLNFKALHREEAKAKAELQNAWLSAEGMHNMHMEAISKDEEFIVSKGFSRSSSPLN